MTLKSRISLFTTGLLSVLFAVTAIVVSFLFSDFRREEFQKKMSESAISSITLLADLKETDYKIMRSLEKQKINTFFKQKTLIFDDQHDLLYSSLDDTPLSWSPADLQYLDHHGELYRSENGLDIYGLEYAVAGKKYFAIVTAYDTFGNRKLKYLISVLSIAFVFFTLISWFLTRAVISNLLEPLDVFIGKIKSINEKNLDTRIDVKGTQNEIDLLANEFNQMLERIDRSLKKQIEFSANASHELRTPISRIIAQLENRLNDQQLPEYLRLFMNNLLEDANQLSELINSLLLLSKYEGSFTNQEDYLRLDDVLYNCIDRLKMIYPNCNMLMDIAMNDGMDEIIEIKGSRTLFEVVFMNLLRNAYAYSDNQQVSILLEQRKEELICKIINSGKVLDENDRKNLFEAFMRGKNSTHTHGFGLGLRIVSRILNQHQAKIEYASEDGNKNIFTVCFHV